MSLNEALRLYRKARNLTQKQVAEKAGISVSYLSLVERGQRDPSLSTLEKIASAMGVSLTILAFMNADEDGLQRIDLQLAQRLKAAASCIVMGTPVPEDLFKEGNVLRSGNFFVMVTFSQKDEANTMFSAVILANEDYTSDFEDGFEKDGTWRMSSLQEVARFTCVKGTD